MEVQRDYVKMMMILFEIERILQTKFLLELIVLLENEL